MTKARLWKILAFSFLTLSSPVLAQDNYPSSPVKLIVGLPAGGNTADNIGRLLAIKLSAQMNANVVVENKPGANGNFAAESVAKAKPDGYTLLFNSSGLVISRALGEKLEYDLLKDFAPVALVSSGPLVMIAHPSIPASTPAQFVNYLKANSGKLAYGSSGTGNANHLGVVLFLKANGLSALHVPYKGGALAMIDLLAGRIQFGMQGQSPVIPMVKENRIKAVAIASLKRSTLLPDVPTFSETIMPGFETGSWFGVLAPAKTPPAIVKRLGAEIVKVMQDPDMKLRLTQEGSQPWGSTSEEYAGYLKSEYERWSKVIAEAGIKLE